MVLCRQDGRGHENGHLLAALYRLEDAAKGHLGLAVADVADYQPVHGPAGFHVELDIGGGSELVERLLVWKGCFELRLPGRVLRVCEARCNGPSGVDLEQLFGEVGDRALDALLGTQPLGAAQLAQGRILPARVTADAVDLLDRQEDLVGAGEAQLQVVPFLAGDATAEHALVAGDAVVDVHDEIARRKTLEHVARDDASQRLGSPNPDGAEELAVGDEHEPIRAAGEPAVEAPADEDAAPPRGSLG